MLLTVPRISLPAGGISLALTFDCGQCFRFEPNGKGGFEGVAHGRFLSVSENAGFLLLDGATERERDLWTSYFGLDRDWEKIRRDVVARTPTLSAAADAAGGIRILRQEPFETLITFVLSQCNNIPRIKALVARLAENYGAPIRTPDGRTVYAFPDAATLAAVPVEELCALKLGYRAAYVRNTAAACREGLIEAVNAEADTGRAAKLLCEVEGIGIKVAYCALLFGFGRLDAFPQDVWIKRAMARQFPGKKDTGDFGPYAGVAQQYLFYGERYLHG